MASVLRGAGAALLLALVFAACSESAQAVDWQGQRRDAKADQARDFGLDQTLREVGGESRVPSDLAERESPPADTRAEKSLANRAPRIVAPGPQRLEEEQAYSLALQVDDPDGDALRVFAEGLPPGARWQEKERRLSFRPDFIQGGRSYRVSFTATDGRAEASAQVELVVKDSIAPPWPRVKSREDKGAYWLLTIDQISDAFLDSPGYAGRTVLAHITVPKTASAQNKLPVHVELHGFDNWPSTTGSGEEFRIHPHDPQNSYWWGYGETLPASPPSSGQVPNYTQRRVLHLLQWLLSNEAGADPERVYVAGGSMGGAGAMTLGLLYARHFCYVEATIGQAIPRNHRPLRVTQLETLWGPRAPQLQGLWGMAVWDQMDLTQVVASHPEAKEQFVFTKHGKDDVLIHFGAVVQPSPLTGRSFYQALQAERIGHYVVWDEGGHGPDDPVLGPFWSDWGWNRITDAQTYLRRDTLFPAFAHSSADQDPGDGGGNGKQPWRDDAGYAGELGIAGDTGWNGELAGARNRFLRWDAHAAIDSRERLELPLKVLAGDGASAPQSGYPSKGNKLDRALPFTVDVSLRRVQRFICLPGEALRWRYGSQSGSINADSAGAITIKELHITTSWQTLVVERSR